MPSGRVDSTRPPAAAAPTSRPGRVAGPVPAEASAAARHAVAETAGLAAGLVLFGATVHGSGWLRLVASAGLILAAVCLARALTATGPVAATLGLLRPRGLGAAGWVGLGLLVGSALAAWYRVAMVLPILPLCLRPFALVAVLIGAAEEVVYRGVIQERLRPLGAAGAAVLAAALHTAYKGALFAFPPDAAMPVDLGLLTVGTFVGGALLGALREQAGNLWPCLLAHAAFDLMVYGDSATVPWWVWR